MTDPKLQSLRVSDTHGTRDIAVLRTIGRAPGVLWMQGFKSDMISTKASALAEWADARGAALTRFDYSGHGQSSGAFEIGTLSQWLADSIAVFKRATDGPQVVVGSSMGGYLAMLMLRTLEQADPDAASRITALVLIAPAWDMTEALMWAEFPESVRADVMTRGQWLRPSQYGDPYPITRALIEDGRRHLFAGTGWRPQRPVRIIQGRLDPDVPFAHTERLMAMTTADDIELIEVADGEHRLSRPEDIALLIRTIEDLL